MDSNDGHFVDDDFSKLSVGQQGSINISNVTFTPTDQRSVTPTSSYEENRRERKISQSNRRPLMHPRWYAKMTSPESSIEKDRKCEQCGTGGQHEHDPPKKQDINSATFMRHKYYSRLTDPFDERMRLPDHILPSSLFYLMPSDSEAKQSSIVTIFAIWNTMMGTSLLSMPWGIQQSGFALGILLIVSTGFLTLYTAYRVLKSKDYLDYHVFEFGDVVGHYFGRYGEWVAVVFGLLAFAGGMMVYWVLMTNFLYMTGVFIHDETVLTNITNATNATDVLCVNAPKFHNDTIMLYSVYTPKNEGISTFDKYWDVTKTAPLYLLIIIFPLLNFKSPTFFTKFNCLGTISVIYLVTLIIVKGVKWGFHMGLPSGNSSSTSIHVSQFEPTFPALTGMLSLAFFLHNAVITILRNNKKPQNNVRDLSIGYMLVLLSYLFVGTIFFATFPLPKNCISSNLLDNLATGDYMAIGARAFLLFQMITVFPLLAYICRIQILHAVFGNIWPSFVHVIVLNIFLAGMCVLVAMFYPHIGDIIRYSGSLCGLVYIFVLPSAVYLMAMHRQQTLKLFPTIFHCLIIALGFANFIAQFIITPSK